MIFTAIISIEWPIREAAINKKESTNNRNRISCPLNAHTRVGTSLLRMCAVRTKAPLVQGRGYVDVCDLNLL